MLHFNYKKQFHLQRLKIMFSVRKEMSICNKLWLSNSYNLATHSPGPLIFQNFNSIRSNILSLKYQRVTPSGCEAIGVRKCEFVAKTQFLWEILQSKGFTFWLRKSIWLFNIYHSYVVTMYNVQNKTVQYFVLCTM